MAEEMEMGKPSASLATLRPDLGGSLEEFNTAMDRAGFIGLRALPVMEVAKQAGTFGKITLEQLLQTRDTVRAPGGNYNRGNFTFTTDSYACQEHGAEEPVDDREAEMYREYFDAELVSTERARDAVLRNVEIAAAAILQASALTDAAAAAVWSNHTSATPITDVKARQIAIWTATGIWPNAVMMAREAFLECRMCDEVIDNVKYTERTLPGDITVDMLAKAFDLKYVLIAGSAKNTANSGQTASLSSIWDRTQVSVGRIAEGNDIREAAFGRTFHWSADGSQIGGVVESYRDEKVRSDVIRCRMDIHQKALYTDLMHCITGVLS